MAALDIKFIITVKELRDGEVVFDVRIDDCPFTALDNQFPDKV